MGMIDTRFLRQKYDRYLFEKSSIILTTLITNSIQKRMIA